MKTNLLLFFVALLSAINGFGQARPFTIRYNNNSVRGNITYVSNSIISSTGIGTSVPGTDEAPPAGTTKNGNAGINIDVDNATTPLMNFGSVWNYYSNGNLPPVNPGAWNTVGYLLGAGWASGNGMFGYGSTQTTCIPSGCLPVCTPLAACNKYWTYYFQKVANIVNPASYSAIRLNIKRNDGIVVYINGTERYRDYMPAGAITNTTAASNNLPAVTPNATVDLSPAFFNNGNNTIAVEVHVQNRNVSEMYYDMEILGVTANSTFNSSTADLNISTSCNNVLFAGLYWGAGQGNNGTNVAWITGENTCLLKIPGAGSYTTVTSSQTDYHNATLFPTFTHTGYKCFANITGLINTSSPNGTYTVANVASPVGILDAYGGWTIVIVYANSTLPIRNLTVFDGNQMVKSGSAPIDVLINGFQTPPGGAVSCELGAVVYDGDRSSTDSFSFKQNGAVSFTSLANTALVPTSGTNDMWNSTIAIKGAVTTARNPAYKNTLGYDANIIDLPNPANALLGNSQTGATVRFASPSENYVVQVLTTSISQYNPSFALQKSSVDLNGGTLNGGDVLRYSINFNNLGNDVSLNSVITDLLPLNVGIVPGSLRINGIAKTDGSGDDQAEYNPASRLVTFRIGTGANASSGGTIAAGGSGTVSFDVIATRSCAILACGNTVNNSARIDYIGQTTSSALYDSSLYATGGGCYALGPVTNTIAPGCYNPPDTTLVNICPSLSSTLPWAQYAGYTFYSAKPFISSNIFNPTTPITTSGIYWAYANTGSGCSDTIKISVLHQNCPDLDEDNDGLPDYLELNNPVAIQDADSDGIPNWLDTDYPGWVDNNVDGLNDNFDPGADADNDGVVNFMDNNWPGFIDTNGDGVNDNMDTDKDGIPDFIDKDSDNDGIPDVVESWGVDANGDGTIDNYTDPDNDGLSQNVDASNGVAGSGNGLGAIDLDGDGIPNYRDLDSDNDGIPDVLEARETDSNNDGQVDNFTDTDLDGFADSVDGDVGNDGIAENSANTLLKTGADTNGDGRSDSYPYKNFDNDSRANPYDLDSDNDGISDCREAGFADANSNGFSDGTKGADGWDDTIDALAILTLRNTDGTNNPDYLDIDSDDDGIPDNVEGLPTLAYILPSGLDSDGDGIDNSYDGTPGFGGNGITPNDQDGDTTPDYRDSDTDNDGQSDLIEGNDFNMNGLPDDLVTLTGIDTDGDGLDNRFDNNNSSIEGTSAYMGNGGSYAGDPTPGSTTMVQATVPGAERDWRIITFLLDAEFIEFTANRNGEHVNLKWVVTCEKVIDHFDIERSIDGISFAKIAEKAGPGASCKATPFSYADNILLAGSANQYFYRITAITTNGFKKRSSFVLVRIKMNSLLVLSPNPASTRVNISLTTAKESTADIVILDGTGRVVIKHLQLLRTGYNSFSVDGIERLANGVYNVRISVEGEIINEKLVIKK